MGKEKKTVRVEDVIAPMNRALRSTDVTPVKDMTPDEAFRMGVATAIETILHHANRYRGFSYLDVDHSIFPPAIPDETRRHYN